MNLLDEIRKRVFLMDGAMGTQIQGHNIPADAWQGKEGCNELLNLTAPDIIRAIHALPPEKQEAIKTLLNINGKK